MFPLNPNDPAFIEDPYPLYAIARQLSPIYVEPVNMWLVFGYDDVLSVLRDPATWSSEINLPGSGEGRVNQMMLFADPPRHTRLRGLVSQAFTPRMVEALAPRIEQLAAELLDPLVGRDEIDAVESLSYPLPVIVIAEILGIPPEDRDRFKRWSDEAVASLGASLRPEAGQVSPQTLTEMGEYFTDLADERRRHPREDLMSGLVAAEAEGSKLDAVELLNMAVLLLVAGNETTTNLIGNALLAFIEHPEELDRLGAEPALLPSAIEEVLRYSSPVQANSRRATRDVELHGRAVKAGQQVVTFLGSANRDPGAFPDADRFDIARTPNRHLAFGHGIHFCLGAPLARLEARIALAAFLERFPRFKRASDGPLPRVPTFVMRGVRSLPLKVDY